MRNMTELKLTDVVLERYEAAPDPRLRTILQSLIRHLHAFARDVRLTEARNLTDDEPPEVILGKLKK